MTMNCLNGFFHFPPLNSLSEALLKAEGKGVIAAFSPSGLSVNDAAHLFHKALLEEIVSGRHERIGDAILAAQEALRRSPAPSPSSSPSTTSSETPPSGSTRFRMVKTAGDREEECSCTFAWPRIGHEVAVLSVGYGCKSLSCKAVTVV